MMFVAEKTPNSIFMCALKRMTPILLAGILSICHASSAHAGFQEANSLGPSYFEPATWVDFNNDGWVDLYTHSQLWRNENGTLVPNGSALGLYKKGVWGDSNRDGLPDFFTFSGNDAAIHINVNGSSVFSSSYAIQSQLGPMESRGAVWGDLNGDYYPDLYVGGFYPEPELTPYRPDKILLNNHDNTYTVHWAQSSPAPAPARGVTAADWDRDGDLDIYVSNYHLKPNNLLRNDSSGNFTDVAASHNAQAGSGHSIGAVWGDFNNDGLLDLFAGNFAHAGQPQSRFRKNLGPGADYAFEDMGTSGVFYQESYASPVAGDIDNDGDLDLYFTTIYDGDHPRLFRNDGNFAFTEITSEWGLPTTGSVYTYQAAFADYDHDGYLDLATNGKVYHNTGGDNHWLEVHLDGGGLWGAFPVGAQVLIELNGQTLLRQVESGVGEGNQNDQTLHFGLGTYVGPVDLTIRWLNGQVQYVSGLSVDQLVTIGYVPEPASLALLSFASAIVLGRRGRRAGVTPPQKRTEK